MLQSRPVIFQPGKLWSTQRRPAPSQNSRQHVSGGPSMQQCYRAPLPSAAHTPALVLHSKRGCAKPVLAVVESSAVLPEHPRQSSGVVEDSSKVLAALLEPMVNCAKSYGL